METLFDTKSIPKPPETASQDDSGHDSSYLSYTGTSFSTQEGPIAPTFPFTFTSSKMPRFSLH